MILDDWTIFLHFSSDSQKSAVTARSKSFSGSRDSLFGSVPNVGISKNFSSDVIRELYGSKTSLLKTLEAENAARRRQSNPPPPLVDRQEPEGAPAAAYAPPEGSGLDTLVEGPDSGLYDLPNEDDEEGNGDAEAAADDDVAEAIVNDKLLQSSFHQLVTLNEGRLDKQCTCKLIREDCQKPYFLLANHSERRRDNARCQFNGDRSA